MCISFLFVDILGIVKGFEELGKSIIIIYINLYDIYNKSIIK